MHPKTAIRKKAQELLLAANTMAKRAVFCNRVAPYIVSDYQNDLPAICIYTMDGSNRAFDYAQNVRYERTVQLAIEIQAEANEFLDDVLDELQRQVEVALMRDDSFAGLIDSISPVSEHMAIKNEGEVLTGAALLKFDVVYFDELPITENDLLNDLTRLHTEIGIAINDIPVSQ